MRALEFKIEIGVKLKDNKRDLIITDREYRRDKNNKQYKWYKYTCNKCGWTEGWIVEGNVLKGVSCSCCCPTPRTVVRGINDIATTHPNLVKYFKNIEDSYTHTYNSNKKVLIKCPDCGFEKYIIISNLCNQLFKCPSCSDGINYPEKIVFSIFKQILNKKFIHQYTKINSEWCNKYKYDFYFKLDSEEYIIETNGRQHYEDAWDKLEKTQLNDLIKKELAVANEIKEENYIIIDCRESNLEFIKQNIIDSRLSEIFNLSNIDWIEVEKSATKNIIKLVCDYWNDKQENETIINVANFFNLPRTTALCYLKKGSYLKWCNYSAKEEMIKNGTKNGKNRYKDIEVFENNISLGVFHGALLLERKGEELFGRKLNNSLIISVCKGNRNKHKGLVFKYY